MLALLFPLLPFFFFFFLEMVDIKRMEGTILRHAPSGPAGYLATKAAHTFGGLIRNGESTILIMILYSPKQKPFQISISPTNSPCWEGLSKTQCGSEKEINELKAREDT